MDAERCDRKETTEVICEVDPIKINEEGELDNMQSSFKSTFAMTALSL